MRPGSQGSSSAAVMIVVRLARLVLSAGMSGFGARVSEVDRTDAIYSNAES